MQRAVVMFAAEFGTGQVFWSIFWFFLFFMWIMLVFNILGDVFRSDDLSGVAKAVWLAFVVFLPYLGVFAYLISRGDKMGMRGMQRAQEQEAAVRDYIRSAAGAASSPADQLASLADLHSAGKLTDAEYEQAKRRVIAG
ncbi:MAG: PLDc N-terminal domain-containing protein [Acidimicrobiia bacterium]|nr:PLDc N-terminal domain-containing protein [Acidimicrobiia bacterium]